ncbi:GIP [Symbiodinium pilosum]|uniref:GIP protein n=1 Tax=Symbiodinium pilosum TaxID=2952 RepID=A0A812K8R5_SYMPI|nr:GIP [Symbiodinium pilosum]
MSDAVQASPSPPHPNRPTVDPPPNLRTGTGTEIGDVEMPAVGSPHMPEQTQKGWGPPPIANHGPGFLKLTPQEQSEIRHLHHNLGHPDAQKFVRYLKQGGAGEAVLKGAADFQCDACSESRKGFMAARPSAIHENLAFNTKVGLDLVSWRNAKGHEFHFVPFIDEATQFHLGAECSQGAEGIIEHFEQVWVSWAGYPGEVCVDPGGEFISDAWALKTQEAGIKVNMSASDSHWQLGRAEIHGSTVKQMLSRMDLEQGIESSHEFRRALRHAFAAKNTLCRADGHTSQQAVLGVSSRLPGSILSDSNASSHALAESGTAEGGNLPEGQRFLEELQLRERARKSFVMVDNSASFRRALLRRTRPMRSQWEPGDLVLYWRRKGGNMRREHGRWHGPAEVIATEKQKVVWLSHAGRLIRASPEQLRAASLREWQKVPKDDHGKPLQQLEPLKERLKSAPQYFDLEGEDVPPREEVESPYIEVEGLSEPDAENTPDSPAGLSNVNRPEANSIGQNISDDVRMPTQSERELSEQSQEVPVPEDDDDDLEFGDCVVVDEPVFHSGCDRCWEIDITPPEGWNLPEELDEDMICLASESRKKRVEVKLRDLTVRDQQRFALAKHKEERDFVFTGIRLHQWEDGSIEMDQKEYISKIVGELQSAINSAKVSHLLAIEDTWVGTAANASEGQAWTGVTRFFLSQKPEASVKALTSQTS